MPELPEIIVIAEQMDHVLKGKRVEKVSVFQPKCLNRPERDFQRRLPGKVVVGIRPLGKWVEVVFNAEYRLLVSLGMGGEICDLDEGKTAPDKSKLILRFTDRTGFFVTFWWFGYFHLVLDGELHSMTDTLGPDPLSISCDGFKELLDGRRGGIKSFLLNQRRVRGIGNFYIQEILFQASLHPLRKISALSDEEKERLYEAIQKVFKESIALGSSSYELDFFGRKGRYGLERISVAYQENAHCPVCRSLHKKIKTGSTMQYICPKYQRL